MRQIDLIILFFFTVIGCQTLPAAKDLDGLGLPLGADSIYIYVRITSEHPRELLFIYRF